MIERNVEENEIIAVGGHHVRQRWHQSADQPPAFAAAGGPRVGDAGSAPRQHGFSVHENKDGKARSLRLCVLTARRPALFATDQGPLRQLLGRIFEAIWPASGGNGASSPAACSRRAMFPPSVSHTTEKFEKVHQFPNLRGRGASGSPFRQKYNQYSTNQLGSNNVLRPAGFRGRGTTASPSGAVVVHK